MNATNPNRTESQAPHLSIVIPAYNEANRIPQTLETILAYMDARDHASELIVVDDGSRDNTVAVVKEIVEKRENVQVLENINNRGKGYSVRRGMLAATGNYRLFSDSDLSTPIEEMERFFEYHKQGYDVCIGSRSLPDSNVEIHQPWYRENMGKIFGLLQKIFLLKGIVDSQCGFKSFTKNAAEFIFPRQKIEGFCFDVEILYIAQKNGFKVHEVPITWRNSPDTRVGALSDSSQMFLDLLRIRIDGWKGAYR